eukprot:scaffold63296_cov60-Phaeocystis_antarctica.AAC.2
MIAFWKRASVSAFAIAHANWRSGCAVRCGFWRWRGAPRGTVWSGRGLSGRLRINYSSKTSCTEPKGHPPACGTSPPARRARLSAPEHRRAPQTDRSKWPPP